MIGARLNELLVNVCCRAGPGFTGIGIIVASDRSNLPIAPLRACSIPQFHVPLAEFLAGISVPEHDLHDGFHVLSPSFELVCVSQYFAPPVVGTPVLPAARRPGARYMAALLGSKLPGVLATGVATQAHGIALFTNGIEAGGV